MTPAQPKQGRVELDLPLDTQSATYDCQAPTQLRIKSLSVQGKPVTLKAAEHGSLAVATFAGGALHLAPLSAVVQLRPSLAHLDAADEAKREAERASAGGKKGAEEEVGEEEGADQLTPLQVQVRRRETERQAEQRLASHAYLRAQQEEEPWAKLQPHGPDSPASQAALSRLRATPSGRAGESVAPASFLDALLPPRTRASPPSDAMDVKRS